MDDLEQYSKSEMIDFSTHLLKQLIFNNPKRLNGSKKYSVTESNLEKTCNQIFREWDGDTTHEVPYVEDDNTNITKQ